MLKINFMGKQNLMVIVFNLFLKEMLANNFDDKKAYQT